MNLIRLDFNMLWLMEVPKELERRPASDKILRDKAFNISKNPKYHAYQRGLPYMVYNLLIKSLQALVLICMEINLLLIMKN